MNLLLIETKFVETSADKVVCNILGPLVLESTSDVCNIIGQTSTIGYPAGMEPGDSAHNSAAS